MRFDDSLATVLAADTASGFGAQTAWRQLVDLAGRRRLPDLAAAIVRLRELRAQVPASVRAASGRALAWGEPPAPLVALFAQDDLAIAAPVLRTASLKTEEWLALLPRLSPATRSVLRHRRDLPAEVLRGLASFGATDFVLGHDAPVAAVPIPRLAAPAPAPLTPTPFVAVGEIARALPLVAEARRQAAEPEPARFEIADLVARIAAFRQEKPAAAPPPAAAPEQFRFDTDAAGVIRWIDGVARGPLIGVTLARAGAQGAVRVDPAFGIALRARDGFCDLPLDVGGDTTAAGSWRLSGVPCFDWASGRFNGLAGTARRPRVDDNAGPGTSASESLRQLVHELRTPVNAIAGFSELIDTELLGPVPPVYRDRVQLIQAQAAGLATAIDDLDAAARLEGDALDLRPDALDLAAVLTRVVAALQPIAAERGVTLTMAAGTALVLADDRAVGRLVDRLLTVALAAAEPGERLQAELVKKTRSVRLHVTRPRALRASADDALLLIDAEPERDGGPLLGTGFTLRLLRNLAAALDGSLAITPDRLTLRLPAAETMEMERAAAR